MPTYDPAEVSHVVTDTSEGVTLRSLGIRKLDEIPDTVPTVRWDWVLSGKQLPREKNAREPRFQMGYEFMYAAFSSRVYAGKSWPTKNGRRGTGGDKGKGTETGLQEGPEAAVAGDEPSEIS